MHTWLKDWLSERKEIAFVKGFSSTKIYAKSSFLLRSMPGPAAFQLYVNDIDDGLTCKVLKFADDTKIAYKAITARERGTLQSDLDRLTSWASNWKMKFNINKCKISVVITVYSSI